MASAKPPSPPQHREVLEGALSRDLQASKDSKGRDPAVSYGDVQLHRHLQRFVQLRDALPPRPRCRAGASSVQLFVSSLFSGLPWEAWRRRRGGGGALGR